MNLSALLYVMLGGGLGSGLRYLVSSYLNSDNGIPWGTFGVNIMGSLIIGFLVGWASKGTAINETHLLLFATGFCGGFTTFSAFALEGYSFVKAGEFWTMALYFILSISLGLLAVIFGMWLAKTQL